MEFRENLHVDKSIIDILEPGDAVYLELYYSLDNKIILKTVIKELDENRLIRKEANFAIGITFLKINEEYLNLINKYLFKRQQDLIIQKNSGW